MSRLGGPTHPRDEGFSLVELMTVLLIMAVLVMIAVPGYVSATDTTETEVCAVNRRLGAQADYRYYLDNNVWSASFADLESGYLQYPLICPSGGTLVWMEEPSAESPYRLLGCSIHGMGVPVGGETGEDSFVDTFHRISSDLIDLIDQYRADNHRWPSSQEPRNFTDLGLDPVDYADPQGHLYYSPDGNRMSVNPESGWTIQVTTTDGQTRTVSSDSGKGLIYDMKTGAWYYESVSGKNTVDIDTMIVVEQ